ncbi:MAG TPA: VIT domain-containing protein [bacterium]|jgi:Ca-activated chloride channel family protein
MNTRLAVSSIVSIAIFLGISVPAFAQGIVIDPDIIEPWRPDPWGAQEPITLQNESIEINLDDQFAHVKITQIFRNNTGIDLEGIYMFPLPTDADISDFNLWWDGRLLTAETLPANDARQIYEQIVSQMRDPGLLEYMGEGLIQARVYPIPAMGTKQVDIEYDWLLPIDAGLIRMTFPLKLDGYSIDRIENLAITARIDSPDTLGTIYSPTHDIDVRRDGPNRASIGFEKGSHSPDGDFVLYVSRPDGAIGLNMLNYSTGDNEGYFLAMIAPEYNESNLEIVPKDFVCVLDTSGSMSGNKIEQAKDALDYIFGNLNSNDRFSLITFATDVYPYFDGWREASPGNISDVRDYIQGIQSGGSTFIEGALSEACKLTPGPGRPMYIIFLTDGLPTVGNTNTAMLVENANAMNEANNGRIFCFGVGDDVDYPFIDRLSKENGGYTANVGPYEDLEQPLSDFYAKIKSPVMTDIEIMIDGTHVYDMLPNSLPDLFLGSQLILTGRYNGEGNANIRLTGYVGDERMTYDWPVRLNYQRDNDYIPRHWATRRVGYLLNQVRLYGENQEVVDEITKLAQRYGIITPYTSMLVTEDEMPMPMGPEAFRPPANIGGFGAGTMENRSTSTELQAMEEAGEMDRPEELKDAVVYAGEKTFYLNEEGYYVDSEYNEDDYTPIQIIYLSDEYFELIADIPDLADYLSVGEQVIVVYDGVAYQIDSAE